MDFSLKYLFGTWWICATVTAYCHCIKQNRRAVGDVNLKLWPNVAAEDMPPRFTLPLLWRGILPVKQSKLGFCFLKLSSPPRSKALPMFTFNLNTVLLPLIYGLCLPISIRKLMKNGKTFWNTWKHFIASSFWCFVAFNNHLKNAFKSREEKSSTLCKWLAIHD